MSNLSKKRRDKLLSKINKIKETIDDDEMVSTLSEVEKELTRKKYGLVWEEHEEDVDVNMKKKIPVFSEIKSKEINVNKSIGYNFLLEGDNLHSLNLLQKTHKNKVDVIYIDPPYNTGKNDFVYNDKFVQSDDSYKHSKWLNFMYVRLTYAKELLRDDGLIIISIDENEFAQLKLLCDNVFGENNLLSVHHIQVRYTNKSLNERDDFQKVMEYVLFYSKNKTLFKPNKPKVDYDITKFNYKITELANGEEIKLGEKKVTIFRPGEYKIEKNDSLGLNGLKATWASGSVLKGNTSGKFFDIYLSKRKDIDGLNMLYKVEGIGDDGIGYRYFTGPKKESTTKGQFYSGIPLKRVEELKQGKSIKEKSIVNYYDFSPDFGNIRHEGGVGFNSGKKPVKMLKQFISYHKNKSATILDFFAGSGSTAQAILELNQEDSGDRKFILATNNENNICEEITYNRIKNVIEGYGKKEGISSNMKYYIAEFVNKESGVVSEKLLVHVKELIQLEHHIDIDNKKIKMVLSENELDDFFASDSINECNKLFVSTDVMFLSDQERKIEQLDIEVIEIPIYYYAEELKEVHEL